MSAARALGFLLVAACLPAASHARGIEGQTGPEWNISTWIHLPEGKERLEVTDLRGRVVYLFAFQSW